LPVLRQLPAAGWRRAQIADCRAQAAHLQGLIAYRPFSLATFEQLMVFAEDAGGADAFRQRWGKKVQGSV